MATKTVTASLEGDGLRLVAQTGSGHTIVMDNAEGDTGARPAELLVVAQAGCTAMDVVSILRKKRQAVHPLRGPRGRRAARRPAAARLRADADRPRGRRRRRGRGVRRAIELSATRYCTVTANLASGVTEIQHAYLVRDAAGEEHYGEVVVTGPLDDPNALGARVQDRT